MSSKGCLVSRNAINAFQLEKEKEYLRLKSSEDVPCWGQGLESSPRLTVGNTVFKFFPGEHAP